MDMTKYESVGTCPVCGTEIVVKIKKEEVILPKDQPWTWKPMD
jgi:hypothetical protein